MKITIFHEQTTMALKKWRKERKKKQQKEASQDPSSKTPSTDTTTATTEASQRQHEVPVRLLHRNKTIAHVGATRMLSDSEGSDTDDAEGLSSSQTRHLLPRTTRQRSLDTGRAEVRVDVEETPRGGMEDSFSFPRLPGQGVPDK
jgi:mlo protein